MQVAAVERRGEQVAVKFYEQTTVRPETVVRVVRGQAGLRLDPSGVLWIEHRGAAARERAGIAEAVRNVLLQLQT
jgi:hypothetical protein